MQLKKLLSFGLIAALAAGGAAFAVANDENPENPENPETQVYTVPVTFVPTQEQFDNCTILNVNGDAKTWTLNNVGTATAAFSYVYNYNEAANDWCFLPPVQMNPGQY